MRPCGPDEGRWFCGVQHAGTRAELELYDSGGDGWLTENDLQQYVEDLLPRLPALTGLLEAFVHFYKATLCTPQTTHTPPNTSHLTTHTSHPTPHTPHLTPHASRLTPHTPHPTPHIPYPTPHTPHITPRVQEKEELPHACPEPASSLPQASCRHPPAAHRAVQVTAVRKFFFFLDARRRGRIAIKEVLCSPILQELLDLRRPDLSPDDLRSNWFSQQSAAQVCDDQLQLDYCAPLLSLSRPPYIPLAAPLTVPPPDSPWRPLHPLTGLRRLLAARRRPEWHAQRVGTSALA